MAAAHPAPALAARNCPTVSGYVYHDVNDNGLRDPGEPPIPGGIMELRNAEGALAGTSTVDENGYYEFFFDATQEAAPLSTEFSATFPTEVTNWTDSRTVPPFDTETGTLTAVDISQTATITSSVAAESLDSEPTIITATVSGEVSVSVGDHSSLSVPHVQAGQFSAEAYDGTSDWDGPSGHNFGEHTASDSNTVTVEGSALDLFTGPDSVSVDATVDATSNTSGSGNVLNLIATTASVEAALTYHYIPFTCLTGGSYTIIQTEQPPAYADGRETAGNVTPLPGTDESDEITVFVGEDDVPNNNFGELTGSLAGYVYVDFDDDGIFDPEEPPIPGVRVHLIGRTLTNDTVEMTMHTLADGSYFFGGLFAGAYEILETQPEEYRDGKDTIGTQGGTVSNDQFSINLGVGVQGWENNFGELPNITATVPSGTGTPGATTPGPEGSQTPKVSQTPARRRPRALLMRVGDLPDCPWAVQR